MEKNQAKKELSKSRKETEKQFQLAIELDHTNPTNHGISGLFFFLEKTKMNLLRNPWYSSLLIFLIWEIVIMRVEFLPFIVHHASFYQLEEKSIEYRRVVAIAFFLGVITFLEWWPQVGLTGLDTRQVKTFLEIKSRDLHLLWKRLLKLRNLNLLWPPILVLLIQLLFVSFSYLPSTWVLMILMINTLLIGISEELMFRGILFHGASSSFGI